MELDLNMGGELTALWLLVSMIDMKKNHCHQFGCVSQSEVQSFQNFSLGAVHFDGAYPAQEFYYRRDTEISYGPFQLSYGLSATTTHDLWIGFGAVNSQDWKIGSAKFFSQVSFLPGVYIQGSGPDLGGEILARAGLEIGIEMKNNTRLSLSLDHRSHGGIYDQNPGVETLQFRISWPGK